MKKLSRKNMQLVVLCGILVVLSAFFGVKSGGDFLTGVNITNLIRQQSMVAIIAASGTLIMITTALDISVGSTVALSGVVFALMAQGGMSIGASLVLAILSGAAVGVVNAVISVGVGISPFITTLGTMEAVRGVAFLMADGKAVVNGLPANFSTLGRGYIGPIPIPVLIMIVIYIIFHFLLSRTLFGKYVYTIGGNRETARLSGVPVRKTLATLYIFNGALAGLSGALLASRLASGNPNSGDGYEFDVITAVYLGGVSTTGGEGTVIGTLIGAIIVGVVSNGMNIIGINAFYQYIVRGGVLVLAVVVDTFIKEGGFRLKKKKATV